MTPLNGSQQPKVIAKASVQFVVSGCPTPPPPLPVVRLNPLTTTNISGLYSCERGGVLGGAARRGALYLRAACIPEGVRG